MTFKCVDIVTCFSLYEEMVHIELGMEVFVLIVKAPLSICFALPFLFALKLCVLRFFLFPEILFLFF